MNAKSSLLLWAVMGLSSVCYEATAQTTPPAFYSGVVPGSPPKYWLESVTHADQSSSRLLVFQTIPGVKYRVESSRDLQNWETVSSLDGMGQQELVPMVQIKPPPTPQPNPPPQPAGTYVWMMMQKATAGGIVIYWISPEYTEGRRLFQSHHYPHLTLDPAWDGSFVYVRKFGDHSFLVSHPRSVSIAPPDSDHGEEDLEMLAVFEQNFATMNQEVRDNLDAVRFIPPPAPPADPNGRKFFRVWADWGEDSDGDTMPDWEEFAMMNGVAGVGQDGALQAGGTPNTTANPTSGDANGNGVPDNEELDFDQDFLPASEDADSTDGAIAWRKTRPTRYALFNVPLEYHDTGDPKWPVDVNSQGMVLFREGVDWGGEYHELPDPDDGAAIQGMAINDHGTILGMATYDLSIENGSKSGTSIWKTPTSKPELVESGNIAASWPKNHDGFVSTFSNDGSFMGYSNQIEPYDYLGDYYWTTDANGDYQGTPADGYWYCADNGVKWGWSGANQILDAPIGGGDLGATTFDKYALVDGRVPVLTSNRGSKSKFFVKNSWQSSPSLGDVTDVSSSGIAHLWKIPANPADPKKPAKTIPVGDVIPDELGFWMNGSFLHLKTLVPGLPQIYQEDYSKVSIPGMADKGTFVLNMNSGSPQQPSSCAMCLPCAVEEDIAPSVLAAYQDGAQDTVPYTGVDDVSITAEKTDPSANNKIWIMAPIGSEATPNSVKFHIPADTTFNMVKLSATNLASEHNLTGEGQQIAIKGDGAASSDADLTLKIGERSAESSPIGIKAMKRRQVKVTVTPVAGLENGFVQQPDGSYLIQNPPDHMPDTDRLRKYLNKVYQLQLNAEIDLTVKPMVVLDFSTMGEESFLPNSLSMPPSSHDRFLEASIDLDTVEQQAFYPLRDARADINVYVFGGLGIRNWFFYGKLNRYLYLSAAGLASVEEREAWVDGDFANLKVHGYEEGDIQTDYVMQCIAHEIGHIIVGKGHPDEGGGNSPLPGTSHLDRLMCAGGGNERAKKLGTRLTKGEWDAADAWLNGLPYGQQTPQSP